MNLQKDSEDCLGWLHNNERSKKENEMSTIINGQKTET